MKKGKRQSIAAIEFGCPPDLPVELPLEYLADLERDAGMGVTDDPNEVIWTDGKKCLEFNEFISGDLAARISLDEILLAIIKSRPDAKIPRRNGKPKLKDPFQYRLEQARKYLIGTSPPRGQIPKEYEADLDRVARRYFLAAFGFTQEASLRDIIVTEVVPPDVRRDLNHKEIDNFIRGHLREFKRHKDRLLFKASSKGVPEIDDRNRDTELVINVLKKLGFAN